MKEIAIKMRIYNNRLRERREALGMTQMQLSTAAGINVQVYGQLETMRARPLSTRRLCAESGCDSNRPPRTGWCKAHFRGGDRPPVQRVSHTWSEMALRLSEFHEVSPDELFPESVLAIRETTGTRKLDVSELPMLLASHDVPSPFELAEHAELSDEISELLATITPREEKALRMRFGIGRPELERSEAADELQVCNERTSQIEKRALQRLRHPSRSNRVIDYWADEEFEDPRTQENDPFEKAKL